MTEEKDNNVATYIYFAFLKDTKGEGILEGLTENSLVYYLTATEEGHVITELKPIYAR